MKLILVVPLVIALIGCDTIRICESKAKKMGIDPVACLEHTGRVSVRAAFMDFAEQKVKEGLRKTKTPPAIDSDCKEEILRLNKVINSMTDTMIENEKEIEDLQDKLGRQECGPKLSPQNPQEKSWRN